MRVLMSLATIAAALALSPAVHAGEGASEPPADPVITAPQYRDLSGSAYSLPAKQLAFRTSLLGLDSSELLASLGLSYGFGRGFEAGINVAHVGAGLFNVAAKWTFLERGPLATSLSLRPVYVHGDWVWLASFQELFAGIDILFLPVHLTGSWLMTPWLQFDLDLKYRGGIIFGDLSTSRLNLDAEVVAREFAVHPGVRVHLMDRATLTLSADLPLYVAIPASGSVEVELEPGVVAGGQLGGTKTKSLDETYRVKFGVRSMVTEKFFLHFGLNFGPRTKNLLGTSVYPEFGVEGRFW